MNTAIKRFFGILPVILGISLVFCTVVSADDYIGGDTGGVTTSCGAATMFQLLCGDPAGSAGGGASWHIYSTSTYSGPTYVKSVALTGDITLDDIKSDCPAGDYDWYAAYGWDGLNGRYGMHLGPAKNGEGTIGGAYYNSYGAKSFDEVKAAISSGNYPNNWKLTKSAAESLHEGSIDSWVGYFCISNSVIGPEYYSSSNASASGTMTGGSSQSKSAATGIQKTYTQKIADEISLRVGDKLDSMRFYHNVYASMEVEDLSWEVRRTVSGALNRNGFNNQLTYYTMQLDSSTSSTPYQYSISGTTDVTNSYSGGGSAKFISITSPQNDDKYKNIYFRVAGVYTFCETIYVDGTALTSACVKVNVGAKTNYRAESNVSCDGKYKGPGSQAGKSTAYSECSIKVNDTIPVVFSHNAYATQKSNNVAWRVNRTSGSGSGMSGSGYTISYPKGSGESANGAGATVLRTTNITTDYSEGLYIADTRPYTDGSSKFVQRDYYSIKFTAAGTYNLCETISVGGTELTTGCAKIVVEGGGTDPGDCAAWAPASFLNSGVNSGTTSIVSAVKNNDAGFSSWAVSNGTSETVFASKSVYAKPGDTVNWTHCYYPGVQTTASTIVTKNNSHPHPSTLDGNVNSLDNVAISSFGTWNNSFTISQQNMLAANSYSSGALGTGNSTAVRQNNDYTVETGNRSRAGLSLTETGTTSAPITASIGSPEWHSWNCNAYDCDPYDCNCSTDCDDDGNCTTTCDTCWRTCYETCYHDKNYVYSTRNNSTASDKVMVKVPYNFINTASIALKETAVQGATSGTTDRIVYAGETVTVDRATINVGTRYNAVTKGTYATRVNGAEVRMLAYTSNSSTGSATAGYGSYSSDLCSAISGITHGNCKTDAYYGSGRSGYLNYNEDTSGTTEYKFQNGLYNVYDVPAGEYYCVVAAVYPYTVSSNTEMNRNGSDSWYISAPDCFKVAKKPSLQVLGGSLYTAKNVITTIAAKNNVAGFYDYSSTTRTNTTIFGSWVEQAVIVPTGRTAGLASGAATGYYSSNGNTRTPSVGLGGSKEGTSVNYCNRIPLTISNSNCTSSMQQAGGYGSYGTPKPTDKAALIERFTGGDDEGINYIAAGDYNLSTTTIPKGETRVISSTGTVTISGNVVYADSYTKLSDVPKLIIYAKDITINCDVSRVDAVLIAENNVNTCPSISYDARENSNQLKINGVVIANTLTANRTYGAATGANSIVPAEIIDYDATLYLWGNSQADADESGRLNITYQRELSPRY